MAQYKRPESVLVVIFCPVSGRVLMLQRQDDPEFWQSVTGSLEEGESPLQTALREVKEEVGIDIQAAQFPLIDCQYSVEFEIFAHLRHRYAPDVTHNLEHWYYLPLPEEYTVQLTEHDAYRWLAAEEAMALTKSWSNRQAIQQYVFTDLNFSELSGENYGWS